MPRFVSHLGKSRLLFVKTIQGPRIHRSGKTKISKHHTFASRTSAFLNIRVADIQKAYREWSAQGVEFLTEPKDHQREIRAYIRDPDGQLKGMPAG